jgi:hypothetical protein
VIAQDTQQEPRTPFPRREGIVVRIMAERNESSRVLHHAIRSMSVQVQRHDDRHGVREKCADFGQNIAFGVILGLHRHCAM